MTSLQIKALRSINVPNSNDSYLTDQYYTQNMSSDTSDLRESIITIDEYVKAMRNDAFYIFSDDNQQIFTEQLCNSMTYLITLKMINTTEYKTLTS